MIPNSFPPLFGIQLIRSATMMIGGEVAALSGNKLYAGSDFVETIMRCHKDDLVNVINNIRVVIVPTFSDLCDMELPCTQSKPE